MADSKITALTSIGTITDPAVDPLVIVDVSDTSMAASGTTKKVTLNNLLSSSPTATGNFTISGDLTVDTSTLKVDSTNNRVGIGTASPGCSLEVYGSSTTESRISTITAGDVRLGMSLIGVSYNWIDSLRSGGSMVFGVGNAEVYRLASGGTATWSDGAGGTRMTLNSTGLGVGVTPAAGDGSGVFKAAGTGSLTASTRVGLDVRELTSGNQAGILLGAMTTENTGVIGARTGSGNIAFQTYNGAAWGERARIDYLGNLILTSPSTPPTLAANGQLTVNATSNTNLRFSFRGSDGTTRVANITLA